MTVNNFWITKISFYFIDILDVDNDGKVNSHDIFSFKEMFSTMKQLDFDSDSYRNFSNFLDLWKNAITKNASGDEISIQQFQLYCKELRDDLLINENWPTASHMKEYVNALFAILDTDNDNFISREDYLNNSANEEDYEGRKKTWSLIAKGDDYKIDRETFDKLCKEFLKSTNPADPGNWIFGLFSYE